MNRSEEDVTKERAGDIQKVHRNLDPNLHQFEKAHEYTRALNAVKLERVFAKPFVASLEHGDGVTCLAKNYKRLNSLLAGTHGGSSARWCGSHLLLVSRALTLHLQTARSGSGTWQREDRSGGCWDTPSACRWSAAPVVNTTSEAPLF